MAAFPVNGHEPLFPLENIINILPPPLRRLSITKINYFLFVFPFGGGCDILRAFGAWKMKIKGFYTLTRRSVMRMISILGIVLGSLYAEATAESKVFSSRVEDVQVELISLKKRLPEDSSRPNCPTSSTLSTSRCTWRRSGTTRSTETPRRRLGGTPRHTMRP